MYRRGNIFKALVLLVLSLLVGCAQQYRKPDGPRSEMAILTVSSNELAIVSVDKHRTSLLRGTGRKEVIMLPGKHVVVVQRKQGGHIAEARLTIDAEAGDRFVLRSTSRGYRVEFRIEKLAPKADITA